MKIAYVTVERYADNPSLMASGYANLPMLRRMPVELTVCTDAEQLRQCAGDMDVVLLEVPGALDYEDDLAFLDSLPVFVGGFHLDTWKGPFWCDSLVKMALNICIYREVTLRLKPEVAEQGDFLWLPPRVQQYNMDTDRDYDVTYWGHLGREYPFRLFCFYALLNISTVGARMYDPEMRHEYDKHVRVENITLNGKPYKFARVLSKYGALRCHGKELSEILHRSKVCPTGPPIQRCFAAPVARYIENAACGVVSLTTEFSEMDDLGFKHGENIWVTTAEKFYGDLELLLTDHDLRGELSANAEELVRMRHTVSVRAQEFYDELCARTGIT